MDQPTETDPGSGSGQPSPLRNKAWLALLLPLVMAGPIILLLLLQGSESVSGRFEGRGGGPGSWAMNVDKCVSGQSQGFFGVELYDSTRPGRRVRAVLDPVRGPLIFLRTSPSGGPGEQIPPEQCRLLDLEVRFTGKRVNYIRGLEGRLETDCDPIQGAAVFSGCY